MTSRSLLVKGGLWSTVATLVSVGFGFISAVTLVRLLVPTDLGLYFAVVATVTIAAVVGSMGLSTPITVLIAESNAGNRGSVIVRGFLIAGVGATAVTFLFLVGAANAVGVVAENTDQTPWWLLALLSAAFIFRGLSVESLVALAKLRASSVVRAIPSTVTALWFLVVLLGGADLDLSDAFSIVFAANALALVIAIGLISHTVGSASTRSPAPPIRRYLAVGLPWLGTSVLVLAFVQTGVLIVAATSSIADAAEFGIAMRAAAFVAFPAGIVGSVIPPFVSRYWVDRDRVRLERLMRATAGISGGVSSVATIVLVAVGQPLLSAVFGEYYSAAWATMVVLSLGFTVDALTGQSGQMMALVGREKNVLYVFLVVTPSALIAMIFLGRSYGSIGVATALALAVAGSNTALAVIARRSVGVRTWASTSWVDVTDVTKGIAQAFRAPK